MIEVEHEIVRINGIDMHLATAGSGPPIILLHGFPEQWYSWRHLIPLLAANHRVIAPDTRGCGRTQITRAGYDLETLGNDVRALIEYAGAPAVVVGHDWGGVIAWHVAAAHPEAVSALVAVAGPHPARYFELLLTSPIQLMKSLYAVFFQVPLLPELLLSAGRGRMPSQIFRRNTVTPGAITDADIELYREAWTRERIKAGLDYYRMLARRAPWAVRFHRTHKVMCPACVVWADHDSFLGIGQTQKLERFCATPPRVHVIPQCSHWIPQEKPNELYDIVSGFLGG